MPRPLDRRASGLLLPATVLAVLLLGLLGHVWLWHATVRGIEEGMARWAAERQAAGWIVSYGRPERGGWPFSASVRFPSLLIASAPTSALAFAWSAGRAEARIVPPDFSEVLIDLPDPQILVLEDLDLRFAAERLLLRLPVEGGTPLGGRLEAERLRLAAPERLPEHVLQAERLIATLQLRPDATEAESALTLSLRALGITLPRPGPFGARVEEAALTLAASGPLPGRRGLRARAEIWRDAGGSVALSGLRLLYGPVEAEGEATLALDESLQPMGAGRLAISGFEPALAALAEAGALARPAAVHAAIALRLIARSPEAGAPAWVEVPLLLENRTLSVLRIPLLRLPPLPWPSVEPGH